MTESVLLILSPNEEQEKIIEQLLGYLIRSGFKEFFMPDVRFDKKISDNAKQVLETWFQLTHDHIVLGHIIFRRRGMRWSYEIHSVESPLLMAEEVLFWLREEYSTGLTISLSDRTFLARVLEIYQGIIEDRMAEDGAMDRSEAATFRLKPSEEFFEFVLDELESDGYPHLQADPRTVAHIIGAIKKYELIKALED